MKGKKDGKRKKEELKDRKNKTLFSLSTLHFSLFKLIANCSILIALTACSYAQIKTQPSNHVFPVETAHEDGDWTLLYRDVPFEISEDGFVIFMLPRDWMPLGLSDYDHLKFSSVISENKAVLTFERFRP